MCLNWATNTKYLYTWIQYNTIQFNCVLGDQRDNCQSTNSHSHIINVHVLIFISEKLSYSQWQYKAMIQPTIFHTQQNIRTLDQMPLMQVAIKTVFCEKQLVLDQHYFCDYTKRILEQQNRFLRPNNSLSSLSVKWHTNTPVKFWGSAL